MGKSSLLKTFLILTRRKHRMSSLYRPVNIIPQEQSKKTEASSGVGRKGKQKKGDESPSSELPESLSKSLRLMLDNGVIRPSSCHGAYHLLPVGMRSLDKLMKIVDEFMYRADCQKIQMPILTSAELWKATGRINDCGPELMKVTDRHAKPFLLSPTHEEAVCDLINCHPVTYRQMPLRLYQITEKFRDEMKPRFGLMRSRQFLMKDLYTFDVNEETARKTYDEINTVYTSLLDFLGVKWVRATGSTGTIGGIQSHEFHLFSDVGEDRLIHCDSCKEVYNEELSAVESEEKAAAYASGTSAKVTSETLKCIKCGSQDLSGSKSIEVAHAFLLGTKYTNALNSSFINTNGKKELMEMGCYGLGVSRLLGAVVEVGSLEKEIRWPLPIAPYLLSIIPPKSGSKEEHTGKKMSDKIEAVMSEILRNDLLIDDRVDQTVGKRIIESKKLGIPYVAVFGKSVNTFPQPLIELHDVNSGLVHMMLEKDIINFMYDAKARTVMK